METPLLNSRAEVEEHKRLGEKLLNEIQIASLSNLQGRGACYLEKHNVPPSARNVITAYCLEKNWKIRFLLNGNVYCETTFISDSEKKWRKFDHE